MWLGSFPCHPRSCSILFTGGAMGRKLSCLGPTKLTPPKYSQEHRHKHTSTHGKSHIKGVGGDRRREPETEEISKSTFSPLSPCEMYERGKENLHFLQIDSPPSHQNISRWRHRVIVTKCPPEPAMKKEKSACLRGGQ